MYTGHLGVALAARRFGKVPLWALVVTSQMPDWLSIVVGATGVEDAHELWSHSLPAVLIGAAVAGCITFLLTARPGSTALVAAVYLSHPVLDLITGLKPTWPAGPLIGGCLYDWPVGDFVVEALFVLAGAAVYRTCIDPARRTVAVGGMVGIVLLCQLGADATQAHRLKERHGTADAASFFAGRRCQ